MGTNVTYPLAPTTKALLQRTLYKTALHIDWHPRAD